MANKQVKTSTRSQTSSKYEWGKVVDMYKALNLPVCDNQDDIEREVKKQTKKWLRYKEGTDPSLRIKADEWFKDVQALKDRRPELIQVVFDQYTQMCNASMKSFLATGKTKLTPELEDELLELAETSCHVDNRLAKRFRKDYMKLRGLKPQEDLVVKEVTSLTTKWVGDGIKLSWRISVENVEVMIFRREGKDVPSVRRDNGKPVATDGETKLRKKVHQKTWTDTGVTEGKTYHYLLIASPGKGRFSKGKGVTQQVPMAPSPVEWVKAEPKYEQSGQEVEIKWAPAKETHAQIKYAVVRRPGSSGPANPDDGEILTPPDKINETLFHDKTVVAGKRYTYSVFTHSENLYSHTGTAADFVDIIPDVTGLKALPGDGTVELVWTAPDNVETVIVRKGFNPLISITDGKEVKLAGDNGAKDEGLENGKTYHYRVYNIYRIGRQKVHSWGASTSAIPDRLPVLAENFEVKSKGGEIHCKWTSPSYGQVKVLRSARNPDLAAGRRLSANRASDFGEPFGGIGQGYAIDSKPDIRKPWYTIFTVAGEHAIAGPSVSCVAVAGVSDLKLSATRDGIILSWIWPQDCRSVKIFRKFGSPLKGPDDPEAVVHRCMEHNYQKAGSRFVDRIHHESGILYYRIYSQVAVGARQTFQDAGLQDDIHWYPWMTIRYHLTPAPNIFRRGKEIRLQWEVENHFHEFPGFVLLANQEHVPTYEHDGIELYRWKPGPGEVKDDHALLSLDPVKKRRWAQFYYKIFPLQPEAKKPVLIIHPDLSRFASSKGIIQTPKAPGKLQGYRKGVPKQIICPICFKKFPPGKMQFGSYNSPDKVGARYTIFNRIFNLPPLPPIVNGERFSRKLCPNDHELPDTAGAQTALMIGLIGAANSGKSHYIASLVDRLGGQVGSDFHMGHGEVGDETKTRYEIEFHGPLFKEKVELEKTLGIPPPLIYDETQDGSGWKDKQRRGVTLVLYDTAGENLNKPSIARRMVQYLGVASGVIFLVDPLQVPAIRQELPESELPKELGTEALPGNIINNVLELLEGGNVVATNRPFSIPIAVVLTKCDVLRDRGIINPDRLWCTHERHIGYFNTENHNDMSGMFGELIQKYCPGAYNTIKSRFPRHAFFGVSATGCAPENRRYRFISPWRVEDPLLWQLSMLRVIPTQ